VNLAPQVEDGQPRHCAETEQDPPGEIVGDPRSEQDRGHQRADDQPGALHREHQADHPAPGLLAGVLAHDRRRHRVVAADADPEDDPADEQERVVRRECRREGPERQDQHLVPVDLLAPEDVGDPAEDDRADRGGQQRRRVQPGDLAGGKVPLGLQQRDNDADHEQVVGIGEESHARHEHDLQLEPVDLGVIERIETARCGR
jgi:hypothetical protein